MSIHPYKLLNTLRNALGQGATQGWRDRAYAELREALQDNDADLIIPHRRSVVAVGGVVFL